MEYIKGVDLSSYQAGIDYSALKSAGVKFAVIRAGFAESPDRTLVSHVNGCTAQGIDYGFYWYSYAENIEEVRAEAAACIDVIKNYSPAYPVFFDAEENKIAREVGRTVMTDIALEFVSEVSKAGYSAGVYANPSWLLYFYEKDRLVGKTDIWLAHWTGNPDIPTRYDFGQKIWQWGIEEIDGMAVDGDVAYYEPLPDEKTIDQLADEVIAGLWGNGEERRKALTEAGYNYDEVQQAVNRKLAEAENKISVGDLVRVKNGALTYSGEPLAPFVYSTVYTVSELRGDRAVITYKGEVTAAVNVSDLIRI